MESKKRYCRLCKYQLPSVMNHAVACVKHRSYYAWHYSRCPDWEEGSLTEQEINEFTKWLQEVELV